MKKRSITDGTVGSSRPELKASVKSELLPETASDDRVVRRRLRRDQRELLEEIVKNKEAMSTAGSSELLEIARSKNDELFKQIHHSREQLNDALNLHEISTVSNIQASRLNDSAFSYDFDSLATSLKSALESSDHRTFAWDDLGKLTSFGILTGCGPPLRCLAGPLNKTPKERAVNTGGRLLASERRAELLEASKHATKPVEVTHGSDGASGSNETGATDTSAEATNERVTRLLRYIHNEGKQLKAKLQHEDGEKESTTTRHMTTRAIVPGQSSQVAPLDLVKLLVDPADAVQSIENFFDYSVLVKQKRVVQSMLPVADPSSSTNSSTNSSASSSSSSRGGRGVGDVLLPFAAFADPHAIESMCTNSSSGSSVGASSSQAVLSLSMRDLKDLGQLLVEVYGHHPSITTSTSTGATTSANDKHIISGRGKAHKTQTSHMVAESTCPLHRSDAIYAAELDVFAQTDMLEARKKK